MGMENTNAKEKMKMKMKSEVSRVLTTSLIIVGFRNGYGNRLILLECTHSTLDGAKTNDAR